MPVRRRMSSRFSSVAARTPSYWARPMRENMHGREMAVAVPQDATCLKLMMPSRRDSDGLVARG